MSTGTAHRAAAALAATAAAVTVATAPGVAGAETLPLLPGTVAQGAIELFAPALDRVLTVYDALPGLSSVVPITNDTAPYAFGPITGLSQTFTAGIGNLADLTSVSFGDFTNFGSGDIGSSGGNTTALSGPFGGALNVEGEVTGFANPMTGVTTLASYLDVSPVAPFGLGDADVSVIPLTVSYGAGTLGAVAPQFGADVRAPGGISGSVQVNVGSVEYDHGTLTVTAPAVNAMVTTPWGDGTVAVSGGTYTAGAGGIGVEQVGYAVTGTAGDTQVISSVVGHGEVTTAPSVTVGAQIEQTVNGDGIGPVSTEVTLP